MILVGIRLIEPLGDLERGEENGFCVVLRARVLVYSEVALVFYGVDEARDVGLKNVFVFQDTDPVVEGILGGRFDVVGLDDVADSLFRELAQLEEGCNGVVVQVVFGAAGDVVENGKFLFKKREIGFHNGSARSGSGKLSSKNHRSRG